MDGKKRQSKNIASVQSPTESARKYIASIPGAVSGQKGHEATIKVASALVWGFSLSTEEAFPLLADWNEKCEPPWSEADLRHKLEDALQHHRADKHRGWLLEGPHFRSSKRRATVKPVETGKVPAKEEVAPADTGPKKTKPKNWLEKSYNDDPAEAFRIFCENKPGITREALEQVGAEAGYHRHGKVRHRVIGIKIYDPADPATVCGCVVYRVDGKPFEMGPGAESVKVKLVRGSSAGIVGRYAAQALAEGSFSKIIRTAGISDHLALQSEWIRLGLDKEFVSFTGSSGENENPDKYAPLLETALKDADYYVVADNDETGRKGAEKWARFGFRCGARVRLVELPEEIDGELVKDTCDFLLAGRTFEDLRALMDAAPVLTEDDFPPDDSNATASAAKVVEAGEIEPISGKFVLDKDRTRPTARAFVEKYYTLDGIKTLRFKDSQFYTWSDNRYIPLESNLIQKQAFDFLSDALIARNYGGTTTYEPFPAKDMTVRDCLAAIQHETFLESDAPVPAWLGEEPPPVVDPSMIIFGKTKNLDIETMTFFSASPNWFNYNALDFDPNDEPDSWTGKCPRWEEFMCQVFGDDVDSMFTLMMYIGLLLTPITKFQKALFIVGPKRSGKGTIAKVVEKLVGPRNYCSPTTDGLASQFGLQAFLGKTVAVISDARFTNNGRLTGAIERLLCAIGEDKLLVDRKFLSSINQRLQTRFMLISNEIPRLPDSSGAIASRFIVLSLKNSFYGQEDTELDKKLEVELPGILAMAIFHLKHLLKQGRFIQPESAKMEVEILEDLGSPISQFIREKCILDPERWVATDDLWKAWGTWCEESNMSIGPKNVFCKDLLASTNRIKSVRKGTLQENRFQAYQGITLVLQRRKTKGYFYNLFNVKWLRRRAVQNVNFRNILESKGLRVFPALSY